MNRYNAGTAAERSLDLVWALTSAGTPYAMRVGPVDGHRARRVHALSVAQGCGLFIDRRVARPVRTGGYSRGLDDRDRTRGDQPRLEIWCAGRHSRRIAAVGLSDQQHRSMTVDPEGSGSGSVLAISLAVLPGAAKALRTAKVPKMSMTTTTAMKLEHSAAPT